MPTFQPARLLCAQFYKQVLAPAIGRPHAAGLLGSGSDVLGYDTERSTDHDWGPRAVIFVDAVDVDEVRTRVAATLPATFDGWPVALGRDGQPLEPHVVTTTVPEWIRSELGTDPVADGLTDADWLTFPQQRLLGVVGGTVFHDGPGHLTELRSLLRQYPDDVWWWMLACQWRRLAQEEAFVQRTAEVGDHAGSALTAARQVRDAMRLALLMARRYWPCSKWLGTAFAAIADPDGLGRAMRHALQAPDLGSREQHLMAAYQVLGRRFNALSPGLSLDTEPRTFHDRPAIVLGAERFAGAALRMVSSPGLRGLPLVGSVDQLVDSTDLLTQPSLCRRLRDAYVPVATS
ncbi:DUF4037 domain-containing protein [Oryzihumus leptocrescens]|uniref:Uncharacterized protein DUF4037 n=1 Tax=Oryzihumus leptocrescens TaxID=297536 RepID=A0A542ZK48_9MICO|nr:DUF4037 domain-containing protein [Oryzihumus leptocrescens]TQL60727.1 uncharacterized protein DUF4037 [Oryzihumus leptocrescens]